MSDLPFVIAPRCECIVKNEATASACFPLSCSQCDALGTSFVTTIWQRIVDMSEVPVPDGFWCTSVEWKGAIERQRTCEMVTTYPLELDKMEGRRETAKIIRPDRNAAAHT
jgi:hypothetical protein